jgi:hypothetical protein
LHGSKKEVVPKDAPGTQLDVRRELKAGGTGEAPPTGRERLLIRSMEPVASDRAVSTGK